jgi:hypothetical protein
MFGAFLKRLGFHGKMPGKPFTEVDKSLYMDETAGIKILQQIAPGVADRAQYIPAASPATVREIKCGVFFILAFWSCGARRAFRQLSETLSRLDPEVKVELVVTDTDQMQGIQDLPEFAGKIHGWGETAWIYDGKIVSTSGVGLHLECYEPNTLSLLNTCR